MPLRGDSILRNITFFEKLFFRPVAPSGESIFRILIFFKAILSPSCPFGGNPFSEISLLAWKVSWSENDATPSCISDVNEKSDHSS